MVCPVGQLNHCCECGYDDLPGERVGTGRLVRRTPPHECVLPPPTMARPGDRFECDCGKNYVMSGFLKNWERA